MFIRLNIINIRQFYSQKMSEFKNLYKYLDIYINILTITITMTKRRASRSKSKDRN